MKKYQLITYTGDNDMNVENTDSVDIFDTFDQAVADGKFATLNECGKMNIYKTIRMKSKDQEINLKSKPSE